MASLKKQTVSGVKWLVGSSFLQKAIQTAATIVLARILGPSEFGLFALAFVAIDALGLFKSMGFDSALIQRKDNIGKAANTAFFVIPILGVILYLILAISAPFIGRFLNNQGVVGVIRALGIIFVISCLGKVPAALLEKNMQFKRVTIIEVSTAVVYSASAIIFALMGFRVWSLVIAYILKTINQNTLTFIYSGWRPKFEFDKQIAKEMFHFGKFLFLGSAVWFLKMNLDNVLVGKLLGVAALGLYAIAFNISNFCVDQLGGKIYRVTYPAYSKLQGSAGSLREAFLKVFKHTSIIALPFGIMVFLLSKELLLFVYGEKWIEASNVLKILSFSGIFNTLNVGILGLFIAYGKPKLDFGISLFQVIAFFVFIMPAARIFGINGVGLLISLSSITAFIFALILVKGLLQLQLKQIYYALKPSLVSTLFMVVGILFLKSILLLSQKGITFRYNLLILLPSAIVLFGVSLAITEKSIFREMKEMVF